MSEPSHDILASILMDVLTEIRGLRADMKGRPASAPASAPAPTGNGGGATFGNYGRNKNGAVVGASMQDLEYYGNGCRRTLADSSKANFHGRERVLLAAIEAEIARQSGGAPAGTQTDFPPSGTDDDIPF